MASGGQYQKEIKMNKVKGTDNPADMNTKGLSCDEIAKHVNKLNMGVQEGRAEPPPR